MTGHRAGSPFGQAESTAVLLDLERQRVGNLDPGFVVPEGRHARERTPG
jgi:hypothetical protein